MTKIISTSVLLMCTILYLSCKKSSSNTTTDTTVPAIFSKIYGASSITSDGTFVTIKTAGLPDHKSVYYPISNPLYEAFSGTTYNGLTFSKNPNTIASQNIVLKIPINPTVAALHAATPGGVIGVAINGIPFFNQYAAMNSPLTTEAVSFDKYWAHPQQTGVYHYHVEPIYLTTIKASKSSLLGFLLDGFPVYGPEEFGNTVTNAMLDSYHGHISATADYPGGIYHYHITSTDPYINGSGFYGTPGTVTQ